jgi:hypothetical protein
MQRVYSLRPLRIMSRCPLEGGSNEPAYNPILERELESLAAAQNRRIWERIFRFESRNKGSHADTTQATGATTKERQGEGYLSSDSSASSPRGVSGAILELNRREPNVANDFASTEPSGVSGLACNRMLDVVPADVLGLRTSVGAANSLGVVSRDLCIASYRFAW